MTVLTLWWPLEDEGTCMYTSMSIGNIKGACRICVSVSINGG